MSFALHLHVYDVRVSSCSSQILDGPSVPHFYVRPTIDASRPFSSLILCTLHDEELPLIACVTRKVYGKRSKYLHRNFTPEKSSSFPVLIFDQVTNYVNFQT